MPFLLKIFAKCIYQPEFIGKPFLCSIHIHREEEALRHKEKNIKLLRKINKQSVAKHQDC